jgi:hypothetical protein
LLDSTTITFVREIIPGGNRLTFLQDQELKYLAQKSFISYMRSVFLQRDKDVFDVTALPADEYAKSLGLPLSPNITFSKTRKQVTTALSSVPCVLSSSLCCRCCYSATSLSYHQDKNMSRAALADVSDSEDDKLISKEDDSEQDGEDGEEGDEGSEAEEDTPKPQKAAEKKLVPKTKKEKVEKKDKSKLDKLFARRSTGLERFVLLPNSRIVRLLSCLGLLPSMLSLALSSYSSFAGSRSCAPRTKTMMPAPERSPARSCW